MEVTNQNFIQLLPEISETIRECDFIAIDTELSGLMRDRSLNRFDLPEERFAKAFESSRGYFILQFGLSCFTRADALEYNNKTYNFYIFPQPHEGHGDVDRTYSIQAHAIQFLISNGFDFNKLFKHGVSYLTFSEKKDLVARLKADLKTQTRTDSTETELNELKAKNRQSLTVAKGFLEVLEQIIINKKPIVGHNLIIDLIQIINQFIEPLNDDYSSFKETCHSLFPLIYDTKFIAHSTFDAENLTNNQSRLNDLFLQLRDKQAQPKISVNHLNNFLDETQLPHQAGYDAYMSGYCFIALCERYLEDKRRAKAKKEESISGRVSLALEHQILNDMGNKIHLSYSYDLKCFFLGGVDDRPARKHVFYMEFPETWTLEDLFQIFNKHGGITVGRINKTTALCALRDPKMLEGALEKVKTVNASGLSYRIYTYDMYLEKFRNQE